MMITLAANVTEENYRGGIMTLLQEEMSGTVRSVEVKPLHHPTLHDEAADRYLVTIAIVRGEVQYDGKAIVTQEVRDRLEALKDRTVHVQMAGINHLLVTTDDDQPLPAFRQTTIINIHASL